MNEPALLILAAGLGSRYGGCKQIDPVGPNDEIILDYSLYDAWKSGFTSAILVVREGMAEPLRQRLEPRLQQRLKLGFANQDNYDLPETEGQQPTIVKRKKPWGTGHAVWAARHSINQPFAVVNADDFYGRETFQLMADFLRSTETGVSAESETYALAAYQLATTLSDHGTVSRGICQVDPETGLLKNIREQTGISRGSDGKPVIQDNDGQKHLLPADTWVSLNSWAFTPEIFRQLEKKFNIFLITHGKSVDKEFYLPEALNGMIRNQECRIKVLPTPSQWFGVTYKDDKASVQEHIRKLIRADFYPEKLW